MKKVRVLLSLIIVVVFSASALSALAIGFEAEKVYESVFVIYSGSSMGSGFAVGENCIVTNAHVIDNERSITAVTYGGEEYSAVLYGIDNDEDIAVLFVEDAQFPHLPIADITTMKTGDDIYAIGAPKGMAYTLTKGTVSAKEREIGSRTYIQIDAPINEGNSGGPLLNDSGTVLGMNTLKMTDSEGIGMAIPINRVCSYMEALGIQLDSNGNVKERISVKSEDEEVVEGDEASVPEKTESRVKIVEKNSKLTYVLAAAATVSFILNIILLILLIYQKKKNINLKYDPRERTDFDIDVWE